MNTETPTAPEVGYPAAVRLEGRTLSFFLDVARTPAAVAAALTESRQHTGEGFADVAAAALAILTLGNNTEADEATTAYLATFPNGDNR